MSDAGLIESIHDYWFGPIEGGMTVEPRQRRWFAGGPRVDAEIRERFGDDVARARAGDFGAWEDSKEDSERGALALVLLLDQFPRNTDRGRPEAFAGDARARAVLERMLAAGRDRRLAAVERCFLYLPLEHSENLADHDRCVVLMQGLLDEYTAQPGHRADGADFIRASLDYARSHREIIARFGRYPHRNEILGRTPTDEERAWLEAGGARFGQ